MVKVLGKITRGRRAIAMGNLVAMVVVMVAVPAAMAVEILPRVLIYPGTIMMMTNPQDITSMVLIWRNFHARYYQPSIQKLLNVVKGWFIAYKGAKIPWDQSKNVVF